MPQVRVDGHAAFQVSPGTLLLDACEANAVPMESACGGFAACNSCRVRVVGLGTGLSPLREEETPFLDADDQRLGCQCEVLGDVRVALSPGL